MYDAYNMLSKGEGVTKWDAVVGNAIINRMRDRRINDEEIDTYWDMFGYFVDEDWKVSDKVKAGYDKWVKEGRSKAEWKKGHE